MARARGIGRSGPLAVFLAAAAAAVAVALGGCSTTRHVGPAEFLAKAQTPSGDVHEVRFVGIREDRAYLEEWTYWPVIGERTTLLWTEAEGLAPEVRQALEAKRAEKERRIADEQRQRRSG